MLIPLLKKISLTRCGVAISFAFLMHLSFLAVIGEYMPLFMAQLGFSTSYIGSISLLGLVTQTVGNPIVNYFSDKYRIRKHVLLVCLLLLVPTTLLFLVPSAPKVSCEHSSAPMGNSSAVNYNTFANVTSPTKALFRRNGSSTSNPGHLDQNKFNTSSEKLNFFLIIVFLRSVYELLKRACVTGIDVAAMTHVQKDKAKYGIYACWGEFGAGISLFVVGMMADKIRHMVCDKEVPGYYVALLYAAVAQALTMLAVPWMNYEYLEKRVVNYTEVKNIMCNPHYILMLLIAIHAGICTAFQMRWEFWYMQYLGGRPLVIAVGGLIRRPIGGVWFFLSRGVIERLGELYVISTALFVFSASFTALAFIQNAWLVIVFDNFQSGCYVMLFASLVVHFSKAGSKASSTVIQGALSIAFYGFGKDLGTFITGLLFHEIGPKLTLCGYAIVTMGWFLLFTIYILTAKELDGYVEVPKCEEEIDEEEIK